MTTLEEAAVHYLRAALGPVTGSESGPRPQRLPAFLNARYRFARVELLGYAALLMLDEREDPEPAAALAKHVAQVRERAGLPTIYVRPGLTAHRRTRLIEHRVPFVVPGNQMYLPDLGIDLRDRLRREPVKPRGSMRPATQALWLRLLLHAQTEPLTAARLAPEVGYTTMTLGRAFDELEALGLAQCEARGRERLLWMPEDRRDAWQRSQAWLVDPVRSRVFVEEPVAVQALRAGLAALADLSRLVEPDHSTLAIGGDAWRSMRHDLEHRILPEPEPGATEVEIWKYAPWAYGGGSTVDPLSLSLSLRDANDERVEQARDEMLEAIAW